MFAIGDKEWPGLSKLTEEAGEAMQVVGKLMGTSGRTQHFDGSDLRERLVEELGDLVAAIQFVAKHNGLDLSERVAKKTAIFEKWHVAPSKAVGPCNCVNDPSTYACPEHDPRQCQPHGEWMPCQKCAQPHPDNGCVSCGYDPCLCDQQ
jgi:NTP pyrophosphatase (non-canonical NTP hydrolase)